ncbi:MAG: LacI family transcriptional regulator [Acidimicrobiaceae bacterium]|nr:LacI family transcriptional regulator [Acidimicrobiaceae bacterium]
MAVTIYDVARHAGVSPRTVSNVVNDYPFVATETRRRVQASIDELGYRPNLMARNLRRGRTGMIALAVPELAVPYFSELSGAIMDEVAKRSYTVIIEQTDGDPDKERKLLQDRERSHLFDGLIFSPLGLGAAELAETSGKTPVVLLGERVNEGPFDHVTIDNVAAARAAVEHLVALGARRIAAIGDQPYETGETAQFRTQGYRQALAEAGIAEDPALVVPTASFHRDAGALAMRDLLALAEPPDAVFCYNDLLAVGAIRVLLQAGCRVPDDVAVIGFDDAEEGRYSTPTLSTMAPDKAEIAALAVEQLFRRLEGDTTEPVVLQAPFGLVVRESTAGIQAREELAART